MINQQAQTIHSSTDASALDIEHFWEAGADLDQIEVSIEPPDTPLHVLEKLGPSPFERGTFPLIGFLATTYDKVSRYALERAPK